MIHFLQFIFLLQVLVTHTGMTEIGQMGDFLYFPKGYASRVLDPKSKTDFETISVKIHWAKREWFLNCSYNSQETQISNYLKCLNLLIDEYNTCYDNFFFIGNFITRVKARQMENLCNLNCWEYLIQKST